MSVCGCGMLPSLSLVTWAPSVPRTASSAGNIRRRVRIWSDSHHQLYPHEYMAPVSLQIGVRSKTEMIDTEDIVVRIVAGVVRDKGW